MGELDEILTLNDYDVLVESGDYEHEILTVEVSGSTYTPPLPETVDLHKYKFIGYSSDSIAPIGEITGTTTTIAQYALIKYTVSFVSLYDQPEPQVIVKGDYAVAPPIPMAPSYDNGVFYAWYTDMSYTTLFDFQNTPITEDITLYARWIPSSVLFETVRGGSTIGLSRKSSNQRLWYSVEGEEWTEMTTETVITLENAGDSVYIRGILSGNNSESDYTNFTITGDKVIASSNCNALWNYLDLEAPLYRCCGYNLFSGCASLFAAPELPSRFLSYACYSNMFVQSGIDIAPELPAERMIEKCYMCMFDGCTNLNMAPELPATTLAEGCYKHMFDSCLSLSKAPELPATTLAPYCYEGMFLDCGNLTTAPELPATMLVDYCYRYMFAGCNPLRYIKCLATDISASGCTTDWVYNVAPSGIFVKNEAIGIEGGTGWTIDSPDGIPQGWMILDNGQDVPYIVFTAREDNSSIGLQRKSSPQTLQYTKTPTVSNSWSGFTTAVTVTLESGKTLYVRGRLTNDNTASNYTQFKTTSGSFNVSGNINALWYYEDLSRPLRQYCGYWLFRNCTGLVDTSELIIPTANASYCYYAMFYGCSKLKTAPELPATTLAQRCYVNMFSYCSSLTSAPELPATTLAPSCYTQMFSYCTSLITAPELPATTLASLCYRDMFSSCTSLTTAPELPATTLASFCYVNMFEGCSSLTTAPSILPATTLANYCYHYMFKNCTSLTTAPELPATTLAERCYESMFYGCSNLTTAPELPATTLVEDCYYQMFYNCTALNYIKCLATTGIGQNSSTNSWVYNVSHVGTFVKADGVSDWTIDSPDGIPVGWTSREESQETQYITFTTLQNSSKITLLKCASQQLLEYSLDGTEWTEFERNQTITLYNVDDKVYVRGKLRGNNTDRDYTQFSIGNDSRISVSGNIASLWDYEILNSPLKEFCGYSLFKSCTGLADVTSLVFPITELSNSCYKEMFNGCYRLTDVPELPSMTLAPNCYENMFYACNGLTTIDEGLLPVVTLAKDCYRGMFSGCVNLTTTLDLPSATLAENCYYSMFSNCRSLTTAPTLLASTLVKGCYCNMFNGCSSLNYIKCLATDISADNCTTNWVNNVALTGTFIKDETMGIQGGTGWTKDSIDGIPSGWTIDGKYDNYVTFIALENNSSVGLHRISSNQTLQYSFTPDVADSWSGFTTATVVTLQSGESVYVRGKLTGNNSTGNYTNFTTPNGRISVSSNINALWNYEDLEQTLYEYCGYALFYNCTGLIDASGLTLGTSATTLANDCYYYIFYNCTNLTTLPALPSATLADGCYIGMFQGCTSLATVPSNILPATGLTSSCYSSMFYGCTSLVTVPSNILPATTLAIGCYQYMFYGCTSLVTVPSNMLPATTLKDDCYTNMFNNCTHLENAPSLPATALTNASYCYQNMFNGCCSLTTAPVLPATVLADHCYQNMFMDCTGLTTVPQTLPSTVLTNDCYHGMFSNCRSLTTAPELPATALTMQCYSTMFLGCTNLTTAPELPATTLASGCYSFMFYNCSSLNYIKCLATTGIGQNNSTYMWVNGVQHNNSCIFVKHPDATDWTTGDNGIPTDWTVQNAP